ncbi:hypothetical protein D3C72_1382790 [compost metagenome]
MRPETTTKKTLPKESLLIVIQALLPHVPAAGLLNVSSMFSGACFLEGDPSFGVQAVRVRAEAKNPSTKALFKPVIKAPLWAKYLMHLCQRIAKIKRSSKELEMFIQF